MPGIIFAGIVGLVAVAVGFFLSKERKAANLFSVFSIFFSGTTVFISYGLFATIQSDRVPEQRNEHGLEKEISVPDVEVNRNTLPPSYFLKKEHEKTYAGDDRPYESN